MRTSLIAATLLFSSPCLAQLTPTAVIRPFASVTQPVLVTAPPNSPDHVFIVDRTGRIQLHNASTGAFISTFLDARSVTSTAGDGGLLCLAFSPTYSTDGTFYIYHNSGANSDGVIARYRVSTNPLLADASSREIVLRYPRPIGHNGGWLGFSPLDQMLYLAVGDGGTASDPDPLNRAQTLVDSFFGKVLRINPVGDDFPNNPDKNYSIPPTNPFVNTFGDDEVWAFGLRNPWRCSFDRATGDFWIADVGQDAWEELNFEPALFPGGRNYGWKCLEGSLCTGFGSCDCLDPALTPPLLQLPHDGANCSITGGYVYRGSAIPDLNGLYLCADWCSNRIWTVDRNSLTITDRATEFQPTISPPLTGIVGFGEDAAGELYLCDFFGGRVSKLHPPPCTPEFTLHPTPQSVPVGTPLTLTASCFAKGPLNLRWFRGNTPLTDDARISGTSNASLTIANTTATDSGLYHLVATSPCGTSQSTAVAITINADCASDWDLSGGVDGDDVISFFADWDAGSADIDGSNGTDGDDVIYFFTRWDSGC